MTVVLHTKPAAPRAQDNAPAAKSSHDSFDKLSSRLPVDSAAEDAARESLEPSESVRAHQITHNATERNASKTLSMAQTADSALREIGGIIGFMRDLSLEAANKSLQAADRAYIQAEFWQLQSQVRHLVSTTTVDEVALIGDAATPLSVQVGIGGAPDARITTTFGGVELATLLSPATQLGGGAQNSQAALRTIEAALKTVSSARCRFGALTKQLDSAVAGLQTLRLNATAAQSRVRDVEETSQLAGEPAAPEARISTVALAPSAAGVPPPQADVANDRASGLFDTSPKTRPPPPTSNIAA